MFRNKKSIVCIEISPWGVNIVEGTSTGKQTKIFKCVHIKDVPETPELIVKTIAKTLKRKRIRSKNAYISIYHPYIQDQYLQVQNLSKKEALSLVKRRVKKQEVDLFEKIEKEAREKKKHKKTDKKIEWKSDKKKTIKMYYDYQVLGKEGTVFALAPQQLIDEYIQLFAAIDLTTQMITSMPIAIANALFFMAQDNVKDQNKSCTSFLHVTSRQTWIILTGQNLFFSREVVFPGAEQKKQDLSLSMGASVKLLDKAAAYRYFLLEVTRFFLYVKQRHKHLQLSSVLIGSNGILPEKIVEDLAQSLQIPVSLFDPTEKLILAESAKKKPDTLEVLKSAPIPLGLLAETSQRININLVPLKVRNHKKDVAGGVIIVVFLITYCLLGVAGYIGLSWAQQNYSRAANSQQQSILQLKPAQAEAKQFEKDRQKRDLQLSVLKRFENKGPLWRGLLYELSSFFHENINLKSLDIIENSGNWSLKTKGVIFGKTSKQAQDHLHGFITNLEESVFFSNPKATKISMKPTKLQNKKLEPELTGTSLSFTLTCKIVQ